MCLLCNGLFKPHAQCLNDMFWKYHIPYQNNTLLKLNERMYFSTPYSTAVTGSIDLTVHLLRNHGCSLLKLATLSYTEGKT